MSWMNSGICTRAPRRRFTAKSIAHSLAPKSPRGTSGR
jgi:hypothetical protein